MAGLQGGFWESFKNLFKEAKRYITDTTEAMQNGDNRELNPEQGTSYGLIDQATGYMNSAEAAKDKIFNAAEAEKQRAWETEMSNTAYQRAVADMQEAGINPILAYAQGGASTPQAAAASANASAGSNSAQMMQFAGNMIQSAKKLKAMENIAKQENASKEKIAKIEARAKRDVAKIAAKKSTSALKYEKTIRPSTEREYSNKEYDNMIDKLEDIVL